MPGDAAMSLVFCILPGLHGDTRSAQTSQLENSGWLIIQSWEGFPGAVSLGGCSCVLIWNWDGRSANN